MEHTTLVTIFDEITQHLMEDTVPSEFIIRLSQTPIFKEEPFHMLNKLKKTEQSAKYHPEGSVWNHTMMVVDEAAKVREQSKDPEVFLWAALLHDIGKPDTTVMRRGKITSYDHDSVGAELSRKFLAAYTEDKEFIHKVSSLVRYHMHMLYVLKNLPYAHTEKLLREVDIHEIALLCRCDRLGRVGFNEKEEEKNYEDFLKVLENRQKSSAEFKY